MAESREHTIELGIAELYRIAVVEGKTTSTRRLEALADACVHELALRGLMGAEAEVTIPAGGRDKDWDVAWKWAGKYRLVISLKSILKNLSGTVPNRIDDAMGETASIQLYSPEIVTGYVMIFDGGQDQHSVKHGCTWAEHLRQKLSALSGRRAPYWSPGTFEAFSVVEVDFREGPNLLRGLQEFHTMMDALAHEVRRRNPGIEEGRDGRP